MLEPMPIAVLVSGHGTTLANLIEHTSDGRLAAKIQIVISSNAQARGLQLAAAAGIPTLVVERRLCRDRLAMSHTIFESCRRAHVRYVAMGGFLQRVIVPPDFENRIVNIHPSLIPAFCGTGLYGRFVHEAVLQYGCKVSGCTVHFVDNQYDHGPIIAQRCVEVLPSDTPESLAARVFGAECELYPQVLGWLAASQVRVENRRVWIDAR